MNSLLLIEQIAAICCYCFGAVYYATALLERKMHKIKS